MSDIVSPRLPPDWEPIAAVWLAWPHRQETWPGRFGPLPRFFAELACKIAESTPVRIIAADHKLREAKETVSCSPHHHSKLDIQWSTIPTDDCWIRDYGPLWIETLDGPAVVDFGYNAWGGKYPRWEQDAMVARRIAAAVGHRRLQSSLILEGGAFESDGAGRLIVTRECLLGASRNPGSTKQSIAQELYRLLGVSEILWLDLPKQIGPQQGKHTYLEGDDTDGHVDQLVRFLDQQTVVVAAAGTDDDVNHQRLEQVNVQVRLWAEQTRPRVEVVRLPTPPPRHISGQRVPQSYCNYLRLGPDRLLIPAFGEEASDSFAAGVLSSALPGVSIEPVDCRDLAWGLGALHCCSMHQPKFS